MTRRSSTTISGVDELHSVCAIVNAAALAAGFSGRESYALQLAVCEACENIFEHGYGPDRQGEVRIHFEAQPGELVVRLRDDAPPFNPTSVEPRPPHAKDPSIGGLGLYIIHRVMDEIEYQRKGGRNMLTMRKVRQKALD